MTRLLLPLTSIRDADRAVVGGKAHACSRLLHLGLSAQPGFAVTTEAFEAHLKDTGLQADLEALLQAFLDDHDEDRLRERCRCFQEALTRTPLDPELARAIEAQASSLGGSVLAVRSSHPLEDSLVSACAGVFQTQLGVHSERLLVAVQEGWAAAYGYEALTHLMRVGASPWGFLPALLIQPMVEAQASGVLFTRKPDGTEHETMVLAAHRGLGEALVSGEVTGETAHLARSGAYQLPDAFPLDGEQVRILRDWGLRLEREFGAPMDIEWAFDGRTLILLQARPITTLVDLPGLTTGRKPIRWDRELAEERFPEPMSPLGWSCMHNAFKTNLRTLDKRFGLEARRPDEVAKTIGYYVYSNADFFKVPGSLKFRLSSQLRFLPRYLPAIARQAHPAALWSLWRQKGKPKRGKLGTGFSDPRVHLVCDLFSAFIFTHAREIEAAWNADLDRHLAAVDALNDPPLEGLDSKGLRAHMDLVFEVGNAFMEPDLAVFIVKSACIWMLSEVGHLLEAGPDFLDSVTSGMDHNVTLAMGDALERLARELDELPHLATLLTAGDDPAFLSAAQNQPAFHEHLQAFLKAHGHVTTTWDLRIPTWGEDPAPVLGMLRGMLLIAPDARKSSQGTMEKRNKAREEAIASLLERLAPWPWAQSFVRDLIRVLHTFMRIDEDHHFLTPRLFPPSRKVFSEIARRLVASRVLEHPDDLYFLTMAEVERMLFHERAFPMRYLVAHRRASFERAWTAKPPVAFLDLAPELAERIPVEGELQGVPASPGLVRGRVRLLSGAEDLKAMQPGEILVTIAPNPAWTPLYAVAAGLVTATGSTLSHGFISAREYGLPAVSGIEAATQRLANGQWIEVDGHRGVVRLLSEDDVHEADRHAAV